MLTYLDSQPGGFSPTWGDMCNLCDTGRGYTCRSHPSVVPADFLGCSPQRPLLIITGMQFPAAVISRLSEYF